VRFGPSFGELPELRRGSAGGKRGAVVNVHF
jgi:hypothetical protein